MRRWICPLCGNGLNGLERPRKDDVRRYCLDCSASTGRLVERTAPALERKRQTQSEKALAKRTAAKDKERETVKARYCIGGFDLQAEANRFWRLPVMREQRCWRERLPMIQFRRSQTKHHSSGVSYGGRIVVTIGTDPIGALEVLLHELVHEALPRHTGHGGAFYPVLVRAAREAWPTVEFPHGEVLCLKRAWSKDEWIRQHLKEGLR